MIEAAWLNQTRQPLKTMKNIRTQGTEFFSRLYAKIILSPNFKKTFI